MKELTGNGIIAIGGFARTGKDTLCSKLIERTVSPTNGSLQGIRIALADNLKNEMAPVIRKNFNMDIWTHIDSEKEMLRPLMVSWAHVRRTQSRGTHWWQSIHNQVHQESQHRWVIIPDLRFGEYENDEVFWAKRLGAEIVHVRQYELKCTDQTEKSESMKLRRVFKKAPNDTEKKNDPIIRKNATYKIEWPDVGDSLSKLDKYVDDLVDHLNERRKIR